MSGRLSMKRLCAIIIFLLLSVLYVAAQQSFTDSLLAVAASNQADTVRLQALQELGTCYMESDPVRGIGYAQQMLQLATTAGDSSYIATAYQLMGICYDYKNDLDSCLYFLHVADTIHLLRNKPESRSHVISDMALAYYLRGIYELSLRHHLQALALRRQYGNKQYVSKTLNNIGLLYKQRKDYANAIVHYRESIAIKEELQDERGLVNTYMNLGSLYQTLKQYDSAYTYATKSYELAVKLQLKQDIAGAGSNRGEALYAMDRLPEAEKEFLTALGIAGQSGCRDCLCTVYHGLGNIARKKNDLSQALSYFSKGLQLSTQMNRPQLQLTFYEDLAGCYAHMGRYKPAYLYRDSAAQLSQQLLNAENLRQINEMTALHATAEKEKEIARLQAEKTANAIETRRRVRERNYFILATLLFITLAAVAYKAYTSNRRKKELLNRQKAVIEQSLLEKEMLLREIHHRVKNNLQLISSLLSLQTDYIKDAQALDAVKESRNRVHSMALIHQNLYQDNDLTGIPVQGYIGKLCENLFSSYNIRPGKIRLVQDIQPMHLDVEVVVPLGLMLNELITNSLKYAFPDNREGAIRIMLQQQNECIWLCVYDNGIGLPPDINITESGTFGFRMIHAFIRKMKSTLKIYSEGGTRVELTVRNFSKVTVDDKQHGS